ncbi:serine hydrolase [Branchiibius sp. NY16-3462-2]|uniref:serine hydrolase n=1 Tax=Branchiibius sp. NY16-3462-2 TaxID=1807500 RepID=UPI00345D6BCB
MMTNHLAEHLLAQPFRVGQMRFGPGLGYGYNGAVVIDPDSAGLPVGTGTYFWDGAAGTWFWVDPEADLMYIGLIQSLSTPPPPLQRLTQIAMAGAII